MANAPDPKDGPSGLPTAPLGAASSLAAAAVAGSAQARAADDAFPTRLLLKGRVVVMDLSGELDYGPAVAKLERTLNLLPADERTHIVINMDQVNYVCSQVVGLLLDLTYQIQKRGGRAACYAAKGVVQNVFDILGLPEVLPCCATEGSALMSVLGRTQAARTKSRGRPSRRKRR